MNDIRLYGCKSIPLASYLAALGVFRVLSIQTENPVLGRWENNVFMLRMNLSKKELRNFFLKEYRPTPILSPWNGRAGFLEGEDIDKATREGPKLVRQFRDSNAKRFSDYRKVIELLLELDVLKEMNRSRALWKDLEHRKKTGSWTAQDDKELKAAKKKEAFLKDQIFVSLRNELDQGQIEWLDAVVALGADKVYSPLLGGSGGVEGSMDLGVNFMKNLVHLFDIETGLPTEFSSLWLNEVLFAEPAPVHVETTAGSLAPGQVGGPNATTGFEAKKSINPWQYVLMLEGAVLFRPALTKRFEHSDKATLSYPFTVEPFPFGAGNMCLQDDAKTRSGKSELWMPFWERYCDLDELRFLLTEGRVTLGRKRPANGLDFARCVAQLGIDRGISSFQRFMFLKRSGDNDLGIPLSRMEVRQVPSSELISDLEANGFLDRLRWSSRRKEAAGSLKRAVGRLESALFGLTQPGAGHHRVQMTLMRLGETLRVISHSPKLQQQIPYPPMLSSRWIELADDGSSEFRIALGLAAAGTHDAPMAENLFPVKNERWRWVWNTNSQSAVWGKGDLSHNLALVVHRRLLDAQHSQLEDKPFSDLSGVSLEDVEAFLSGETGDRHIAGLLQGLVWLKSFPHRQRKEWDDMPAIPCMYRLLKPFFVPDRVLVKLGILRAENRLPLPLELVRLIASDHLVRGTRLAWRRLRHSGLPVPDHPNRPPAPVNIKGGRLLAALMIPLHWKGMLRLAPKRETIDSLASTKN